MDVNIIDTRITNIVKYIIDDDDDDISNNKCTNLCLYNEMEKLYNIYFLDNKKAFYNNYILYKNSRITNSMPEWMVKRLLVLDKLDSLHKYGDATFLHFLNNKLKK